MAVPLLPIAKNTGDVVDDQAVDRSRALHAWHRDEAPLLKTGRMSHGVVPSTAVDSGVSTEFLPSSVPAESIGNWPAGLFGQPQEVGESGVYRLNLWVEWEINATGYRVASFTADAADAMGTVSDNAVTITTTRQSHSIYHRFVAGQDISISVVQNSGVTLDADVRFEAEWVRA